MVYSTFTSYKEQWEHRENIVIIIKNIKSFRFFIIMY